MIPDGHPVRWDLSFIPYKSFEAPTLAGPVEEVRVTGWAADVPKEVSSTNRNRDFDMRGPLEQPS